MNLVIQHPILKLNPVTPILLTCRASVMKEKQLSRETLKLPDTVKPEHPEDSIIPDTDDMINGVSMLIGCDL